MCQPRCNPLGLTGLKTPTNTTCVLIWHKSSAQMCLLLSSSVLNMSISAIIIIINSTILLLAHFSRLAHVIKVAPSIKDYCHRNHPHWQTNFLKNRLFILPYQWTLSRDLHSFHTTTVWLLGGVKQDATLCSTQTCTLLTFMSTDLNFSLFMDLTAFFSSSRLMYFSPPDSGCSVDKKYRCKLVYIPMQACNKSYVHTWQWKHIWKREELPLRQLTFKCNITKKCVDHVS